MDQRQGGEDKMTLRITLIMDRFRESLKHDKLQTLVLQWPYNSHFSMSSPHGTLIWERTRTTTKERFQINSTIYIYTINMKWMGLGVPWQMHV
jgi:hypothetical protein